MCGIGGILRTDGEPIPAEWLDLIDRAIAPRGPDGHGRLHERVTSPGAGAGTVPVVGSVAGSATAPGADSVGGSRERTVEVALVHRRLAILDRDGGAQPMVLPASGRDGSLAVVFNGCIYNHRWLRAELERGGHRFRSDHSDTEALLHGWRAHGSTLPTRLEGMYAFAIWDAASATLALARDPFGEKPLWCVRPTRSIFAFCSAAAPLFALWPEASRRITPDTVADFLRCGHGWNHGERLDTGSPIQLDPGSSISVRVHGATGDLAIECARHHRLPEIAPGEGPGPTIDTVERALNAAVAARLESDVPIGCFLSGGVDSALIAAFARRHVRRLRTFCVRMPDPALDESERAAAIAAHLGTDHATLDCAATPAEDLVQLLAQVGVPFGDSSILPTHWVSRAARAEVAVALSGDGGDELFLGYRRHERAARVAQLAPLLRLLPPQLARGADAGGRRATLARLGDIARDLRSVGAAAFGAPFSERLVRHLVPDANAPQRSDGDSDARDPLRALRQFDVTRYLTDDLLLKVDTASMAVALEVRAPMLDRAFAQLALGAPLGAHLSAHGVRGRKAILRAVARRHLPAALVDGPKRGFAIPIARWWREDHGGLGTLLKETLLAADPFGSAPIDVKAARGLLEEHLAGRFDHGQRLFVLLSLALWGRSRSA